MQDPESGNTQNASWNGSWLFGADMLWHVIWGQILDLKVGSK
jgi:hypothetical protein